LAFNTIFQLAAHDRAQVARATHLLMLPELVVHHLTGAIVAEHTSAGTTGLVDVSTGDWSAELCDTIDLDVRLLSPLQEAGTQVGSWRDVPVHLVAGHDTASAVFAGGLPDHAFVSSGTWLLVGREQRAPDTSEAARLDGFSNEPAAFGGTRLLRNVAGWWLVEECRRQWDNADLDILLAEAEAEAAEGTAAFVDATDERFLAPSDMVSELRASAALPATASRATIVRTAVESMAATTATVVDSLPPLAGAPLGGVRVFGGGSRAQLYLDALRRRTDLPVTTGPVEATAIGNALAQGLALGVFASPERARATLADRKEDAR
jgi:rhamnulokinase